MKSAKKFEHTVKFSYLINIKYIQYQHKNVSYVKWIYKMGRIRRTMNVSNILSLLDKLILILLIGPKNISKKI